MKPVFLDTVGLLALWDKSDQWHEAAVRAFQPLQQSRAPLRTTSFIMLECGNAAARRPYRAAVARLRAQMEVEGTLVFPTEEDWRSAWAAYESDQAARAGLVDHVSFVVMKRLGLRQAFTNDRHFLAAGFETLVLIASRIRCTLCVLRVTQWKCGAAGCSHWRQEDEIPSRPPECGILHAACSGNARAADPRERIPARVGARTDSGTSGNGWNIGNRRHHSTGAGATGIIPPC